MPVPTSTQPDADSPDAVHPDRSGPDLARLRFEGSVSQGVFRAMLDTLSHPGRTVTLDSDLGRRGVPFALVPALALVAGDTTFALAGSGAEILAPLVADATGSRIAPVDQADLVVVLDELDPEMLVAVKRGTALIPEAGARVIISVPNLDPSPPSRTRFVLRGPGVNGSMPSDLGGLSREAVEARDVAVAGFPAGIDIWLTDPEGRLAALPRTTQVDIDGGMD
jgi:alpha-D-ribose 1-methylphosphonate 5-triphosphate synthase subunit PhnH